MSNSNDIKATWLPHFNAVYLTINSSLKFSRNAEYTNNTVIIDLDENDQIIGIELLLGHEIKTDNSIFSKIKRYLKGLFFNE